MIHVFLPASPYDQHWQANERTITAQAEAARWAVQNCQLAKVIEQNIPVSDPGHSHSVVNFNFKALPQFRDYGAVVIVGDSDAVMFKLKYNDLFKQA